MALRVSGEVELSCRCATVWRWSLPPSCCPLLVGAGLVVAVVVPAQLRTEASERLEVAAAAVSAMQVQSCLGAGDAARVMALAVVGR